jgi:hypothetical protein
MAITSRTDRRGETSLAKRCSPCRRHHRYPHEYGFTVEVLEDGDESGGGADSVVRSDWSFA